jgi:TonB family protein
MADIRELYSRRVEAASIAFGRGDRSEAERLYAEALVMGEEHFGADDAELAAPLNELSRVYLRRSEYARAEPLLQRLLTIRRASGAQHPDVATVLAGLAAARHGLGDDAAAEGLYREALVIREKVHAPDHMAVVVTLEHLAETCAALRKFPEASALLERAMAVRVVTLGADHPTVRALRERLADLALKSATVRPSQPVPLPAPPATPAPEELGVTKELVFIYEPEKPVRRSSIRRDRVMTPPFSVAVAAASIIAAPAHAAAPPPATAPTRVSVPSLAIADASAFESSIVPQPGERVARASVPRRRESIELAARAEPVAYVPKKRPRRYGVAAGGLALLGSALFLASSRFPARTTSEPSSKSSKSEPLASVSRSSTASGAAALAAPARLAAVRADSMRRATMRQMAASPTPKSPQVDAEAERLAAAPGLPLIPTIGNLAIPEANAPNVDSVMRASTPRRDTDTDQIAAGARLRTRLLGEDRSETSPVLVGVIPQPRFPDALRAQRIEGAVVVQFLVDVDGSVDQSSMKVVRSPHELFTEAVRNVLPKLHFQPARTADAKPRAEWVQYSIQFSATR